MVDRKQTVSAAAVLGVAVGLAVSFFVMGYYSGTTKKVPIVIVSGKTSFEDAPNKYDRHLSVVRVPESVKLGMKTIEDLELLTRYKNERRNMYAVDNEAGGSVWSEDITIGFADGGPKDTKIYHCFGQNKLGIEYTFYSTFDNCWGSKRHGVDAGFTLPRNEPSMIHLAVYSCLTPENNRYLSLNPACESETDKSQEILGYVRAATVLVSEENKPDSDKKK